MESTSRQYSGESSSSPPPPPPSNNNQAVWIGAAAILLGGGAYFVYNSQVETSKQQNTPKQPAQPTKREPNCVLFDSISFTFQTFSAQPSNFSLISAKIPPTSSEIPKEVPYLLIGGGTASFAAFRAIKSQDPKAKVMVLTDEIETPYMRPPLSKELWFAAIQPASNENAANGAKQSDTPAQAPLTFKQWNGVERSLFYEPNDFYTHPTKLIDTPNGGVSIVRGYKVKKIDVENRIAILTDGTEIKYRECLIATGASPKNLPVFEKASPKLKERISVFKTIEDYGNLRKHVDQSKSVAIIGGGFLGSELACALAKYGKFELDFFTIFFKISIHFFQVKVAN